jgi:membrane fusion protein (multidrug efflux system)
MRTHHRAVVVALASAFAFFGLSACDEPRSAQPVDKPPPAPQVSVVTLTPTPHRFVTELPGRIAPTRVAEVRARVAGIVLERTFQQGAHVKAGDLLYRIDPSRYEVELAAAEAAHAKAIAALEHADLQLQRVEKLVTGRAASQAQYESALATSRQARADVAARAADVKRAKLDLDYTSVRAPISGRIGGALVTEGALVGQGEATHLATIQQLDPIYADFTQSAAELHRLRRDFESGALEQIDPESAKIQLALSDGAIYPYVGKLLFSDATVDPSTGQITLRGEFPNPNRELLPGMYVRVHIEQGIDTDALTLPQQAIRRNDTGGSEVYVLRDDNRAIVQPVDVGRMVDNQWIVQSGLKPGDRVVVEGFQKFRAGELVDPLPWKHVAASAKGEGKAAAKLD